jgi:hypothetical protein
MVIDKLYVDTSSGYPYPQPTSHTSYPPWIEILTHIRYPPTQLTSITNSQFTLISILFAIIKDAVTHQYITHIQNCSSN